MTPNDVLAMFSVVATITILAVVALQPSPDERIIRAWIKTELERQLPDPQPPTLADLNETTGINAPKAMPDVYYNSETNSIEDKP